MIRRALDAVYLASGYIAAFFMVSIGLATVLQVVGRKTGFVIEATEIAGFSMAASTFFALAHTFKRGSHVRVTLLVQKLMGGPRRFVEVVCCAVSAVITGYAAYFATLLVVQSYSFGDISPGLLAIPFWIPQSAMAAGLLLLTVAFIDEAIMMLTGKHPAYAEGDDSQH